MTVERERFIDNNYTSLSNYLRDRSVFSWTKWEFWLLALAINKLTFEHLHSGLCDSTICHGGNLPSVPFFPLRNCVSGNGWVGWLLSSYFIDARIIGAKHPKP